MRDAIDRRTFITATGAAGVTAALPFSGVAGAASTSLVDSAFDLTSDVLQEALVVFESNDAVDQLANFALPNGYYKFDVLPIGYTEVGGGLIEELAALDGVRRVERNKELELYNDDTRDVTRADEVQSGSGSGLSTGYTGEGVHAAVIDSGVDGDHPDLRENVAHNWQWVGNPLGSPTLWTDVGIVDTDGGGHGTHCSGTVAGDGSASDGQFRGMAPDADLDVYAGGAVLVVLKTAAAYDHLLKRVRDGDSDVKIVSNSYGSSNGEDFDPDSALNTATWEAYQEGLLSVFAAGNSGPGTNTLNQYAKAPHVLGVAATNDQKAVTNFSSRGRKQTSANTPDNWDRGTALDNLRNYYETGSSSGPIGVYRPGIGAPGNAIVSTMSPGDVLGASSADDGRLFYATISGTSMACPATVGIATLVVDAYRANNGGDVSPTELLNTLTAEAEDATSEYTPYNVGSGFVDAYAATSRAESGTLAGFSDVTLV
ncbi:S8 family serine peptidase [Halococcus sp. AFM35]|uniref:S8 family serine peptidase n=1 Tax=Halococcus sp. AFM35 TaxID=3421653 RepID=UPI003EB99524